jgi:hypothetical protein
MSFSSANLDYLWRTDINLSDLSVPTSSRLSDVRRLWRIHGVGVLDKTSRGTRARLSGLRSKDALIGLYGVKIPLAFLVRGSPAGVEIYFGTWLQVHETNASDQKLDSRRKIVAAGLNSAYLAIDMADEGVEVNTDEFPLSGLALGVPIADMRESLDQSLPLDRLIRAMSGTHWASLVLAEPVEERFIRDLQGKMTYETQLVQAEAQAEHAPDPLASQYLKLLSAGIKALTSGLGVGMWRTAVYLLGDSESYYRLASEWRGIFSSENSLLEPVRVWEAAAARELADTWDLPDVPGAPGPGPYQHPVRFQTLMTSDQLANYIHLPALETSGFAVQAVPIFDAVPHSLGKSKAISLGKVIVRKTLTETEYGVDINDLTRHVFIPGVTGAGKTTTIFHLLRQAWAAKIPFLVVEPAKTEYRELRNYPEFAESLRVFTPGDESCSPIRLNPFELLHEKTSLSLHIDLLRSVFTHSFGLWNPLPQILEKCLYLIYQDKGWDVTGGFNRRTRNHTDPSSFPTLSDLEAKISEVTSRLQWDVEAKGRIQGALRDKLRGLLHGGRGRMLDVPRSLSMSEILENPTVLELERAGDEDDKAFLMGLLLIRLWEYRRAQDKPHNGELELKHLLVLEEAHSLLTNVPAAQQQGETDARAKAVEGFTNLLSEIRAYGQGVIIADQDPVRLAPAVIKNTNLKIAHRIVDDKNRRVLAGSMAMTDPQAVALEILERGTAVVFREGEDAPLLVQVPPPPKPTTEEKPVEQHMAGFKKKYEELFLRHPGCTDTGEHGGAACDAARALVETPTFRQDLNRLILSVVADDSAADRLWNPIEQSVNSLMPGQVDRVVMLQCTIARAGDHYASRRGSQANWSYEDTNRFGELLKTFLSDLAHKAPSKKESLDKLRRFYLGLNVMAIPYYSRCLKICASEAGEPSRCLYRHAVGDVVEGGAFTPFWNGSSPFNEAKANDTWKVCSSVANILVENHANQKLAFRRIGLCYGQMMLAANGVGLLPAESRDRLVDVLCDQPGYKGAT